MKNAPKLYQFEDFVSQLMLVMSSTQESESADQLKDKIFSLVHANFGQEFLSQHPVNYLTDMLQVNNHIRILIDFLLFQLSLDKISVLYTREGEYNMDWAIPQAVYDNLQDLGVEGKFVMVYPRNSSKPNRIVNLYELIIKNMMERYSNNLDLVLLDVLRTFQSYERFMKNIEINQIYLLYGEDRWQSVKVHELIQVYSSYEKAMEGVGRWIIEVKNRKSFYDGVSIYTRTLNEGDETKLYCTLEDDQFDNNYLNELKKD